MSRRNRLVRMRVVSEGGVARALQMACFAASPALLLVALRATARLAGSPGEVLLGVLGASAVALLLVALGLLVPLAVRREGPAIGDR